MGENLRNRALQYYISKGLSPQAAAGIVGMLMSESSLSPDSVNTSSGAYGLAQWLGPRKRELFRRYGPKPTFDNQLDYTWYEMNNTHKNALKYLNAAQTPEDAAKAAFGYYAFMTGPEGAIKEMEKYGQNGKASLAQKIKYANDVYNLAKGNTLVVPPRYEKYQNPNGKVEKTYIADTLPELVVTGNSPKLTLPSISQSQEQAMAKQLLSASGFNPDMPMWEQYTPSYRPLVIPQHYEDGKEGQNADATWHENWLSGRQEQLNENLSLRPRYKYMNSWDLQHQIERLKTTPEYSGSLSDGTYGVTTNHTITYDDAQINKDAGIRVDLSPESVRVHERTHALQPLPQEDKIMRIGGNNTTENPYTDKPSEIYAGLMEQRYRLGLSPEYKVTLEDIKQWRNEKKLNMYLENKSDEILLRYFNEVAYNPTPRLNIPDIT